MKQLVEAPFTRLWMMMIVASLVINVTLNATVSSAEMLKSLQRPVLSQPKVGDSYGGGIIIYLNATGQHGLIASATDVATANNWYDAKMICNDFLNGYGDWFLPNKQQLNQIFINKNAVGHIPDGVVYYWSSTEASETDAWYQNFATGIQKTDKKLKVGHVRAVRSF